MQKNSYSIGDKIILEDMEFTVIYDLIDNGKTWYLIESDFAEYWGTADMINRKLSRGGW